MSVEFQKQCFEPWQEYQHPAVRQLAFVVASPNILRHLPSDLALTHTFQFHTDLIWQQHYVHYVPRLKMLDQDPTALLNFLQKLKSTRLGLRFEWLIWFWLLDHHYHPYQLLGHSLQKIEGTHTLGELDFLLLNTATSEIEHWEVALKYYLAEADLSLKHWYGLNRSDTLLRKLNHFTQKQFQFTEAMGHQIQQRFAILKGQLYLPQPNAVSSQVLPNWVNPTRRLGCWGYQIPSPSLAYRLQRQEWICPNRTATSQTAIWWTDGLYLNPNGQFYMYRNPPLANHKIDKLGV